ncbi:hypothetical protein [Bacteriovorax sp. DB6_IX]|uniref:hypothetical protein n=1 Tax=Bacteriovorax sp. DB6_IX TaxID=1353530 RepID=UPI00041734B7|nr:hypothetical protein [Bacteriovorax sp. DB6_IX]
MYFIDTDLNSSKVYVIPIKQIEGREYVIECDNLYLAKKVKNDLLMGRLRIPINNEEQFLLKEYFEKLGKKLAVYTKKGA